MLPSSLRVELNDDVAVLRLCRSAKRNALDDDTVLGIEEFFSAPPEQARAVVLDSEGDHFSAGLDLSELTERDVFAGLEHSMMWHRAFDRIESGRLPVIAVLRGAVVGGGSSWPAPRTSGSRRTRRFTPCPRASMGCSWAAADPSGCHG